MIPKTISDIDKYDNLRIILKFPQEEHERDVSDLLIRDTASIADTFINSKYTSTLDTFKFSLEMTDDMFRLLTSSYEPIMLRVYEGEFNRCIFDGTIEPTFSSGWAAPIELTSIPFEAIDRTSALDRTIPVSISMPANVDGQAFYIFNRSTPDISLLYRILDSVGLADLIADDAPDITITVRNVQVVAGETTARAKIDTLLYQYGWALCSTDDKHITWKPTAYSEPTIENNDMLDEPEEILDEEDILSKPALKVKQRYESPDGVKVIWPIARIRNNQLLWRANLPIGNTSDPTPGTAIASGDYWPEDSDILETWQEYDNVWTDEDYLSGSSRRQNDDARIIASSGHYLKDVKDPDIEIDPIDEDNDIVYEALRCRLRYINNGDSAEKLYWAEVYGKALVQTARGTSVYPENSSTPEEYEASYIYNNNDAERLAQILHSRVVHGRWDFTFSSLRHLELGKLIRLRQGSRLDTLVIITARSRSFNRSGIWSYKAVACGYYDSTLAVKTKAVQVPSLKSTQDGDNISDFSVIAMPPTYPISSRNVVKAATGIDISVVCSLVNMRGNPVWSLTGSPNGVTLSPTSGLTTTVHIAHNSTCTSFRLNCTIGGKSKYINITAVPTGKASPVYLGELDQAPADGLNATEEGPLMIGDHYLKTSGAEVNVPYYWNGTAWANATAAPNKWQILSNVLSDATDNAPSSTSAVYAFFRMLAANDAFVRFLKTWSLEVGSYDELNAEGFRVRIKDHDETTGQVLQHPLFDVMFDDAVVFKIFPESGNVFLGEPNAQGTAPLKGFMYRRSDGKILSANNQIIIDEIGNGHFVNVIIEGGSADFGSALFAPGEQTGHSVTLDGSGQAMSIWNLADSYSLTDRIARCTVGGNSIIKYVKATKTIIPYSTHAGSYTVYTCTFYNSSLSQVEEARGRPSGGSNNQRNPFSSGVTVTLYTGGNTMVLKDLPSSAYNLESGRIWQDNGTLKVVT